MNFDFRYNLNWQYYIHLQYTLTWYNHTQTHAHNMQHTPNKSTITNRIFKRHKHFYSIVFHFVFFFKYILIIISVAWSHNTIIMNGNKHWQESKLNTLEEKKPVKIHRDWKCSTIQTKFLCTKLTQETKYIWRCHFFFIFCELINIKRKSVGASHIKLVNISTWLWLKDSYWNEQMKSAKICISSTVYALIYDFFFISF